MAYTTQDSFDGVYYNDDNAEAHLFTCENDDIADLSLSVFTNNSLYDWCYDKENQKLMADASDEISDIYNDSEKPYDEQKQDEIANAIIGYFLKNDDRKINIMAWRTSGRNGSYVEIEKADEWTFDTYRYSDLGIDQEEVFLLEVIRINDEVIQLDLEKPDKNNWTKQEKAKLEFVTDIMASKTGCITWTGLIKIPRETLNQKLEEEDEGDPRIEVQYEEQEEIEFKLYLFDSLYTRESARKVTLKKFNIVGHRSGYFDGIYTKKEDGKLSVVQEFDNPKNEVAGELDLQYNDFTGKWESGTPQVIAILTTNIPAATGIDLDFLKTKSIDEILDSTLGQQITWGSAIPLHMQNGNPLQWAPNYKIKEEYRDGNLDKAEGRVYNIAPREYSSGEMVFLNRINGLWFPLSFGEPGQAAPPEPLFIGKWDLTYLMTNVEYFFRDTAGNKLSYDDYEKAVYKAYYYDEQPTGLNIDRYSAPNYQINCNVKDGYFQVTSWDFMGGTIGGLRDNGHALACTQFAYDPNGNAFDNDGEDTLRNSIPFFGCVFPNGYSTDTGILRDPKPYDITPARYDLDNPKLNYFIEISNQQNVFENVNDNSADGNAGGMFIKDIAHLPADIGTNCSPSGQNGRPISNIHMLPVGPFSNIQTDFARYFDLEDTPVGNNIREAVPVRYNWLRKFDTLDNGEYGVNESAFDLLPTNGRKIQFRPLMMETYAAFEVNADGSSQHGTGEYGNKTREYTISVEEPLSLSALYREIDETGTFDINRLYGGTGIGLKYSSDIGNLPNANFPIQYWAEPWMGGEPGAGAVGIIGAVCTIQIERAIELITDSYIGMDSYLINPALPREEAWEGTNGYNNLNRSALYARAFQQWPRELTVYDHRFFSVFHFNPGVEIKEKIIVEEWYLNGVAITGSPPDGTPDEQYIYPTGYYTVSKSESTVDYRVPSYHNGLHSKVETTNDPWPSQNGNEASPAATGVFVWSDYTTNSRPLRNISDWAIDKGRRGKLLPFSYYKTSLTLNPEMDSNDIVSIDNDNSGSVYIKDYDIFIINPGTGYTTGNTFTIDGVDGAELECSVGVGGAVASFNIKTTTGKLLIGEDINPSDLSRYSIPATDQNGVMIPDQYVYNPITTSSKTNLKITTKTATGTGLEAYVCRAVISNTLKTDEKPKQAFTSELINLLPPAPREDGVRTLLNDALSGREELLNVSDNNQYDIFFHFHNDTTHTFGHSYGNSPQAWQQKIDLEIILDP